MFRPVIELLLTIAVVLVLRAVLTSIMLGFARTAQQSFRPEPPPAKANPGGELHKDPVCGTYVAENGGFMRRSGGQTFYYCSRECYEKHSLVAH